MLKIHKHIYVFIWIGWTREKAWKRYSGTIPAGPPLSSFCPPLFSLSLSCRSRSPIKFFMLPLTGYEPWTFGSRFGLEVRWALPYGYWTELYIRHIFSLNLKGLSAMGKIEHILSIWWFFLKKFMINN